LKQDKGGHIVKNFRCKIIVVASHFFSGYAHGYALSFQITLFGYSRNDVFEAVRGLSVKSSKGENLLQVIDSDHGFVIFTTMTNLNFLFSDISDIFMDGTFKCCPKYFEQLYTLHGFKNRQCTTDMSSTTRKVGKCVPSYVVSYY
jgi:hypothetical protein